MPPASPVPGWSSGEVCTEPAPTQSAYEPDLSACGTTRDLTMYDYDTDLTMTDDAPWSTTGIVWVAQVLAVGPDAYPGTWPY